MVKPSQPSVILPSSLLIDPTKEALDVILTPYRGLTHIPSELASNRTPGLMVFVELNRCFEKSGQVAEGMLSNVIWGFHECGYDEKHVAAGLAELKAKGYVYYSDRNRVPISEYDYDGKKPVWIRYTKKFTDLLVREVRL
jgi:hypothetical protein